MQVEERATVLLVDDEPENLAALLSILKDVDANFTFAQSGEEALRRILDENFTLILLDMKMPGMDGLRTASIIRSRERNERTPLIFVTSATPDEIKSLGSFEPGPVDLLYKPIVPEILRSKISVYIDLHRKNLEIRRQWEALLCHQKKESERQLTELKQLWEAERLREAVRHQQELSEASALLTANLERSNKELERFAAVASHDLQEPLRTISSYLKLLADRYQGKLDPSADEFIDFAVNASDRMRRLIVSVLHYSKIVRNETAFGQVDCSAIARDVLKTLNVAIQECGAEISVGALPVIRGDPNQILQLFQNLIENAIKYRRAEPPHVSIWADRRGPEWIFSVTDNGIGIARDFAGAIFEPFRRLHDRSRYSGSGIGLAACKKIVELHGGRIWVESKQGEGSTFRFTLPA